MKQEKMLVSGQLAKTFPGATCSTWGKFLMRIGVWLFILALSAPMSGTAGAAAKTEILVGTPLPVTGMLAAAALEQKWAYEQAVADINKKGGIFVKEYGKKLPVRLIIGDAESDPGKAVAAMERLIKLDKVDVMLSGFTTNHILPTCMTADKYKKYYHCTTCLLPPWKEGKYKWSTLFFFDLGQASDVPFQLMNSLSKADRPQRLALLMEDTIDGRAFGGGFKDSAKKFGYSFVVDEPMAVDAKDYSSQILKFKTKDVDGILIFGSNTDCTTFVRQMKEVGLNTKYFHGWKGTWSHEFYKALGKDADYTLMDGFWSEDFPYPGAKELGQRYVKDFGKHSVSIGLYYALCQILWEAIEKAGSLDSAKIRDAVLANEFKGTVMGDVKYGKDQIAVHLSTAHQWWDGYQELAFPIMEKGWKVKVMPPWDKR